MKNFESEKNKAAVSPETAILKAENLSVFYGDKKAVDSVNLQIQPQVTAIIGPSGCGKSTLLRSFNRMNDFISGVRVEGKAFYKQQEIYGKKVDAAAIRSQIGMVFQRPNPFPKSIIQNVTWGPKINGLLKNADELVQQALTQAALWDEVKDRLHESALNLSGGQQQRLCIARAIAMNPEVILMDEPCSALDPNATARIEDLIGQLSERYTIVIVTHNMQQAARVSKMTAFFYNGKLIEYDKTKNIFTKPKMKMTEEYITGRFG